MAYRFPGSGLYAIVNVVEKSADDTVRAVQQAVQGGARAIQYRDKSPAPDAALAGRLVELCHAHGVPLIVNDNVGLARAVGADGVHLGRTDDAVERARNALGSEAIIGLSCYDSLERALDGERQGVTYVAFGRFFPSKSKPNATPADKGVLALAKTKLHVPIVAIGGITPHNGAELLAAGADLLAVIDGVFGAPDPQRAAARYDALFRRIVRDPSACPVKAHSKTGRGRPRR